MRTRSEHMRWCKERAIQELDAGSASNALASLVSDFGKHDDTRDLVTFTMAVGMAHVNSEPDMRRFIDGFAE